MGIVDNIKKRMSGAEDEESYDEAYNDDEYYNDSFGAYDDGIQRIRYHPQQR